MKLDEIVKEYLESLKYSIKLKTYLFYLQFVESYISKFVGDIKTQNLNDFIVEFKLFLLDYQNGKEFDK
mgnify:CR=1 FL=1